MLASNGAEAPAFSDTWKTPALSSLDLIPYTAVDREVKYTNTHTATSTSYSTNTWDSGAVLSSIFYFSSGSPTSSAERLNRLHVLIRPDWLKNYVDRSEIWSLNVRFVPLFTGPLPLNSLRPVYFDAPSDTYEWTPLLDFRLQKGWFTARRDVATNLRLNEDFVRLGGRAGAALEANWIPGNPIDFLAEYIDFAPLEGFNKSLGFFETQVSWKFGPKSAVSISAQYQNGRRDDTAQRYEAWSISLGFQF